MINRKSVQTKPKSRIWKEKWLFAAVIFPVVFFYFGYLRSPNRQTTDATDARTDSASNSHSVPLFYQSAEAAQPFPSTLSPALFKEDSDVAHAYEIAKKNPGLLAQQPCYCWCSLYEGHRSLLDCYASVHAKSCDICIKEALLAETMSRAGKSADEIRAAIIRRDWKTAH